MRLTKQWNNSKLTTPTNKLVQIYIAQPTRECGNMAATPKSVLVPGVNMGATVITIRDNKNIST